jgi:hypothetical protein
MWQNLRELIRDGRRSEVTIGCLDFVPVVSVRHKLNLHVVEIAA